MINYAISCTMINCLKALSVYYNFRYVKASYTQTDNSNGRKLITAHLFLVTLLKTTRKTFQLKCSGYKMYSSNL